MKKKNRGLFITFEGGEGAGKTTLMHSIYQTLLEQGKAVIQTFEPGATSIGKIIRSFLLDKTEEAPSKTCELFLFLADRAHHVQEVILPALQEGKMVLCDRFNDSTLAYQEDASPFDESLLHSLCMAAARGLTPDLTLYLDIDPKIGLNRVKKRKKSDRFEDKVLSFHEKVRARFLRLAQEDPQRVHLLRAEERKETIYAQALSVIESLYG